MEPEKSACHRPPGIFRSGAKSSAPPHRAPFGIILLLALLLVAGIRICPSAAAECDTCVSCHGSLEDIHGNFNHTANPGSGPVVLHEDTDHDDAGWRGEKPYFAVGVNCGTCHHNDLPAIHGNNCATCHPNPYRSLGIWQGGCQQGGCHPVYHEDSTKAHLPWENAYDYVNNDCDLCHGDNFAVTESHCLNCHATYGSGDTTPPETSTNALGSYIGPARIDFSIRDNGGKVGIGRTSYRLGGGPEIGGMNVFVTAPGQHVLEFWSIDQSGNVEAPPKITSFSITQDITPPTTTSDAKASYYQGAKITLTATDNGTLGVKNTFYSLNDGPTQTGTVATIPATSGTITYTLSFWSVDWSDNIEPQKSVTFTVTSGTGTIRLVWGDSDVSGSPCPGDPEANAAWTIRSGSWSGKVVASGSGGCPNWSGIDNIAVPVTPTPYFISVDWWDSYYGFDDNTVFQDVYITTPGEITRLSY